MDVSKNIFTQPNNLLEYNGDNWALAAKVGKPYGLMGWLHLLPNCEDTRLLSQTLLLMLPNQKIVVDPVIEVDCERLKIRINSITEREEAALFTHSTLWFQKGLLPQAEDGTYYWSDLIGCRVLYSGTSGGECVGTVTSMLECGSYDTLLIEDGSRKISIPFLNPEFISYVDLSSKTIVLSRDSSQLGLS